MKNLIVYYSLTGNTEAVAKEISKLIDGDLKKIELVSEPKSAGFAWAAIGSLIGLNGKIKKSDFFTSEYDNVFIGGQVWAGHSSTPVNAILSHLDFKNKNVYVFLTQADDKEPGAVFKSIVSRVEKKGGNVIDTFYIQTQMKNVITSEQLKQPVLDWINKNNIISGQ